MIADRIKTFKRVKVADLIDNPKNWRKHPDAQRNALGGLLESVGWADAVLARETDEGLMLIDGHLRKELADDSKVPVLVLDVTEAEADLILATHDPLTSMAETDQALLDELVQGLEIDNDETQKMLDGLASDPVADVVEDDVPELPEEPTTKTGDLFELGDHRLLCGDCRKEIDVERLMNESEINVAITSPPYASQRKYDEASEFKPIPTDEYVTWFELVQHNVATYLADDGSWFVNIKPNAAELDTSLYVMDLVCSHVRDWGWHFATEFCWERNGMPQQVVRRFKNGFEPVYQFARSDWKMRPEAVRHKSDNVPLAKGVGAGDTDTAKRQGTGDCAVEGNKLEAGFAYPSNRLPTFAGTHTALGHAAAFPVGLPTFFIKAFSDKRDIVYDPFLGSGTTLIAAEQLDRKCYGMEISPAYCDVIIQRWENLTGKKAKKV